MRRLLLRVFSISTGPWLRVVVAFSGAALGGLVLLTAAPVRAQVAPQAVAAELTATQRERLSAWQALARERALAQDPAWLDLLHFKRHPVTRRWRSLADDSGFFNSPQGSSNPQAELDATLAAFLDPRPNRSGEQAAQCRFPARLRWLTRQLDIRTQDLPEVTCERYDQWRAGLRPGSVSLIFPAAYVNSPASMYGHTFLRINPGGEAQGNPMLAYTISYAAAGNEADGLAFAFRGLVGLYPGIFTTTPYYRRIEEYTHLENRDIWEYDLELKPDEITQLLAHTWELGFTRFDYYFFDENCSYHLLSLLDVARPGLQLTDRFTWWAIPVDTVRVLFDVPGLVRGSHYRPSNSTELTFKADALDDQAVAQAREVALGQREPQNLLATAEVEPQRRARALELAERHATYIGAVQGLGEAVVQPRRMAILAERARLPVLPSQEPPRPIPPQAGHDTARVDFWAGRRDGRAAWRLGWRPAYHDLMDPEAGFQRGAQIQFFSLDLTGEAGHAARLERLTPVDIVSLTPRDRLLGATSWKVSFGLTRAFGRPGAVAPLVAQINAGPGLAWEIGARRHAMAYALMDNQFNAARRDTEVADTGRFALGSGLQLGLLIDPAEGWRLQLDTRARWFLASQPRERSASLKLRRSLGRSDQLMLQCERQWRQGDPGRRECLAGWQHHW